MKLIYSAVIIVQHTLIKAIVHPNLIVFKCAVFHIYFTGELVKRQDQALLTKTVFICDEVNIVGRGEVARNAREHCLVKLYHVAKSGFANDVIRDKIHPLVRVLDF